MAMQIKHGAIALALAAIAGAGAWLALGSGSAPAPESSFVLLDGSRLSTSDLRGKVVLVNFWATSAAPSTPTARRPGTTPTEKGSSGRSATR